MGVELTIFSPILRGEGKGAHTPVEAADSLFSNNIAHILDILSEGEIEGIVGGKKGIFYNEVPLEGPNGEQNFQGVVIAGNNGTPDQPALPGFDDVRSSVSVSQDLPYGTYKTISFPNGGDVTAIAVTVAASNFFEVTKDGDTVGTSVSFDIERSQNGGSFEIIYNGRISGKQADEYTVDYRIPITDPSGNTAVRIKRTKPTSTSLKINDAIKFKSYTKIVEHRFSYPNLATYGHIIDAKQFGNQLPSRQYRARGILCRIPHNYDPVTRAYTGPFNGTFTAKVGGKRYTNNPVYVFYEIVTNRRYGLGKFFDESLLDIPSLYMAAKWCDEMVSNGRGGMEPRWTCNTVINTRGEAFNLLKELVSAFRGSLFWMQAKLWAVGDQPREPVKLVTNANVLQGRFMYSGESNRKRFSVYNIAWNDPDLLFRRSIETVEDPALIREFGYKPTDYGAFACSSPSQARRVGRAMIYAQENEDQIVSYKSSFDHMAVDGGGPDGVAPGDLVLIADKARGNAVAGGRIKSTVGSTVTLDRKVDASGAGTIWIEHVDGGIEWLTCTYDQDIVTLTENATRASAPGDVFILIANGFSPEPYVVLKISREGQNVLGIAAVKYDEGRYAAIYGEQNIDPKRYMSLPSIKTVQPVASVRVDENYITGVDVYARVLDISWPAPTDPLYSYVTVSYSKDNDNWITLPNASGNTARIPDAREGHYQFQVSVINRAGLSSRAVYYEYVVGAVPDDTVLQPGSISGLVLQSGGTTFSGRDAKFAWKVNTAQSAYMADAGIAPSSDVQGLADPVFRDCIITVRAPGGAVVRTESVIATSYTYTYEKNVEDNAGAPLRQFTIGVQYHDAYGRKSAETQITVSNPAPVFAGDVVAVAGSDSVYISMPSSLDTDYAGSKVYMGLVSPVPLDAATLVYTGLDTVLNLPSVGLGDHYIVAIPVDAFGDGTPSPEIAAQPIRVLDVLKEITGSVNPQDIIAGATAFVAGLDNNRLAIYRAQLLAEDRKSRFDSLTHMDGMKISTRVRQETTERVQGDEAIVTMVTELQSTVEADLSLVQATITDEATTRANADTAETTQRQSAVSTLTTMIGQEAADRTAAISGEATTRTNADAAETAQRQSDISNVTLAIGNEVASRQAAISNEQTTRADADAAETTQRTLAISTVTTALAGEMSIRQAAIASEASTRAADDMAETSARQTAISGLTTSVATTNALIQAEAMTRATADSAETTAREFAVSTLTTNFQTVSAALSSETTTRANADMAETLARQTAISQVNTNVQTNVSAIQAEAATRADADITETNQRIAAISSVTGALATANAAIITEGQTRATADSAETLARTTDVSTLTTSLATTNAAISAEALTRADADSAETIARTSAVSTLTTGLATANGSITAEALTRANADIAETNARTSAVSTLTTNLATANGAITSEAATRASADMAETLARQDAVSTLTTNLATASALISAEAITRANADTAETNIRSSAVSTLTTNLATTTAALSSETTTRASADSALTLRVNDAVVSIGSNTARLSTVESVAADAYGRSRAYIQQTAVAGSGRAQLTLYADSNGGGGVDLIGDLAVSGNLIVGGTITTPKVAPNAITKTTVMYNTPAVSLTKNTMITSASITFVKDDPDSVVVITVTSDFIVQDNSYVDNYINVDGSSVYQSQTNYNGDNIAYYSGIYRVLYYGAAGSHTVNTICNRRNGVTSDGVSQVSGVVLTIEERKR